MKKVVLLLVAVTLLSLSLNAQSNSPLEEGVYSLDAHKSLGIDTSGVSGTLIVVDGGLTIKSRVFPLSKYNVFFIGQFENASYELTDSGSSFISGLGYWGEDNVFEDGEVMVAIGKNNSHIIVTTVEGSYSFFINGKY